MKTIFVVDDVETNLMAAKAALDDTYRTFALPSAARMLKLAEKIMPDLILLDVDMPDMDGFEAITILKSDERLKSIPVVFLTSKHDEESELRGFEMGALDFMHKPFSSPILRKRLAMHIEVDQLIKESEKTVRENHNATISVIADLVESRDKITGGHIERTQRYLEIIINELIRAGFYADEIAGWDTTTNL